MKTFISPFTSRPPVHPARAGWPGVLAATCLAVIGTSCAATPPSSPTPTHVELRQTDGRWLLHVNGAPFYVKGAGVEFGSHEKLREHGGNSLRTWSTDNGRDTGREFLDRALTNGLYVAFGLDVRAERRGFDYDDPDQVARQFELLKAQVLEYKDHPALLLWVIGNELNLHAKNPKVWDAVNDLAKMIREVDPNHPTTTALAGFNRETVAQVSSRAPEVHFLSFQMYSDIANLPRYLREANWNQPYMVTEWGATGHWECGKTAWGAPIENDSTTKAELYAKRFRSVIQSDQTLCLGSYVFLWGNKQERTPTWYGMFLETGEATAPVDVMHELWTGQPPANRSPRLEALLLDGKRATDSVRLLPGNTYSARVMARDPDGDVLTYRWKVMEESTATSVGGDREEKPPVLDGLIADPDRNEIVLQAPDRPGAYRLFTYVYDGQGNAAHANVPFHVDAPEAAAIGLSQP